MTNSQWRRHRASELYGLPDQTCIAVLRVFSDRTLLEANYWTRTHSSCLNGANLKRGNAIKGRKWLAKQERPRGPSLNPLNVATRTEQAGQMNSRSLNLAYMEKLPEPYQSLFEAMLWDCGAEAVPELVRKGADLSYCDPNTGRSALCAATIANRPRAVEALLQHGAAPNQQFTYRSPVDGRIEAGRVALHYASSTDVAAALIRAGADVNLGDATGTTPLMCAAFHGHLEVVRALLVAGASPLARQQKRRSRKAHTARDLAESKIEFWREAICDQNREAGERRLQCYQDISGLLLQAETELPRRKIGDA
jgi:hypothetical protein